MFDFFRPVPKRRSVKIKSRKGLIFHNPSPTAKFVFYITNVLIIGTFGYLIYLYSPLVFTGINYLTVTRHQDVKLNELKAEQEKPVTEAEKINTSPDRFKISIPKIGAESWVATNVSPDDKEAYSRVLKQGLIAQSNTSSLPDSGSGTSSFLFAHSSEATWSEVRNNPVFYLLGKLDNEDKIFVDIEGKKIEYKVFDKKVIKPSQVEYLNYTDPSREVLILQTCWPIGTNWNRLLVFAEKVDI